MGPFGDHKSALMVSLMASYETGFVCVVVVAGGAILDDLLVEVLGVDPLYYDFEVHLEAGSEADLDVDSALDLEADSLYVHSVDPEVDPEADPEVDLLSVCEVAPEVHPEVDPLGVADYVLVPKVVPEFVLVALRVAILHSLE